MTESATRDTPLKWDVFVTPGMPIINNNLPPREKQRWWSPISSTLIYGKRDAVLVDTPVTVEQTKALINWVATSAKSHLNCIMALNLLDASFAVLFTALVYLADQQLS